MECYRKSARQAVECGAMAEDFDVVERVCGFSLVSIKSAVALVGIMDDRDDVRTVGTALHCHDHQALRVLKNWSGEGSSRRLKVPGTPGASTSLRALTSAQAITVPAVVP